MLYYHDDNISNSFHNDENDYLHHTFLKQNVLKNFRVYLIVKLLKNSHLVEDVINLKKVANNFYLIGSINLKDFVHE